MAVGQADTVTAPVVAAEPAESEEGSASGVDAKATKKRRVTRAKAAGDQRPRPKKAVRLFEEVPTWICDMVSMVNVNQNAELKGNTSRA